MPWATEFQFNVSFYRCQCINVSSTTGSSFIHFTPQFVRFDCSFNLVMPLISYPAWITLPEEFRDKFVLSSMYFQFPTSLQWKDSSSDGRITCQSLHDCLERSLQWSWINCTGNLLVWSYVVIQIYLYIKKTLVMYAEAFFRFELIE